MEKEHIFHRLYFFFTSSVLCEIKPQGWKLAASVLRIFPTLFFQRDCPEPSGTTTMLASSLVSMERLTKCAPSVSEEDCLLGGLGLGQGGHVSELSRA